MHAVPVRGDKFSSLENEALRMLGKACMALSPVNDV